MIGPDARSVFAPGSVSSSAPTDALRLPHRLHVDRDLPVPDLLIERVLHPRDRDEPVAGGGLARGHVPGGRPSEAYQSCIFTRRPCGVTNRKPA